MNEQTTEIKKSESIKNRLEVCLTFQGAAERRCSELADEFTRLEVQIATLLFAFAGFFFNFFNTISKPFTPIVLFGLKLMFASSLFFLILSLVIGLLHLKNKEKFWEGISIQRLIRLQKWTETLEGEIDFDKALAFHKGTISQNGISVSTPIWSWVIQTICLGIAIVLLFTLFLVFLFH